MLMAEKEKANVREGTRKPGLLKVYSRYLKDSGLKIDPAAWIAIALVAAFAVSFAVFFVITLLSFNEIIIPIIAFIVVADFLLGMPYLKGLKRVEDIERSLPDALKQMADTLKAGSTYESALREVAVPEMGALGIEMQNVLRKLEEGENFENSLMTLSENVNSRLVKRVVTIIIDTVRAGAGLAEILEDISEDAREMYRVNQDRRTRTMLQVLFIVTAGAVITPFIFGIISQITAFLISVTANSGIVSDQFLIFQALATKDLIALLLEIYIAIEVLASSVMMALMRDGNASKSLIYFPALLLIAFVIFFVAKAAIGLMLASLGAAGGIA